MRKTLAVFAALALLLPVCAAAADDEPSLTQCLTSNPKAVHGYGSISGDGRWLAYGANDRDERNFDVLVMDLETNSAGATADT
ncbi:MAG: hypothetical protein ABR576_06155 [Thermoanaerobaculia bacterium]